MVISLPLAFPHGLFIRLRSFHIAVSHSIYCMLVIAQQSEFPLFNSIKKGVNCYRFLKNVTDFLRNTNTINFRVH